MVWEIFSLRGQVMDFNQLDLFVWLALWSLSLWLNTSMHPLKNPGVLRNCQDLYLIFPFPFLLVWCTVNFEPVYVNVNSSFAERGGLVDTALHTAKEKWANRVEIFAIRSYKSTRELRIAYGNDSISRRIYILTFPWITPSSSLLRFTNVLIGCPRDW